MSIENSNSPAMPCHESERMEDVMTGNVSIVEFGQVSEGLTKREHFAGMAMQGLLSNSGGVIQANAQSGFNFCNCNEEIMANLAVICADALLNELDKTEDQ